MKYVCCFLLAFIFLPIAGFALSKDQLYGQYRLNCFVQNEDAISSDVNFFDSDGASVWTETYWAYEDSACQHKYLKYEIVHRAFVPAELDTQALNNLDLQVQSVKYTALTPSTARSLNYISFCGFSRWTAGVPVDVTGKVCQERQQLEKDHLLYSSLKIHSKTVGEQDLEIQSLQFGIPNQDIYGESPDTRMKDLSSEYSVVR